jgi:hypothetical protein
MHGRAIVELERTLQLNPRSGEAAALLARARSQAEGAAIVRE